MTPSKVLLFGLVALMASALAAGADDIPASSSSKKIKVFILAGQSNMEGRGFPEPLSWQVTQKEFRTRSTPHHSLAKPKNVRNPPQKASFRRTAIEK